MEHKARLHPLLTLAAISVSIFSLVGIGAVTGLLPRSAATKADVPAQESPAVSTAPAPSGATADLVGVAAGPEQMAPEPAKKPAVKKKTAARPAPVKVADATPSPAATIPPPPAAVPAPAAVAPIAVAPSCADCGTVENFRQVEVEGKGSGVGAVAGGATGAVIGHQFGRGSGKDLLTIAGAIGGALAGHQIEKSARKSTRYEISVRMEDGSLRQVSQETAPAWRIGDRVRVVDGHLVASS